VKLEYLIVFQNTGVPIYSSCYAGFCANNAYDDSLLTGFLSALTSMPAVLGKHDDALHSVELGYTKLNFSHTTPSGHVICAGVEKTTIVPEHTQHEVEELISKINDLLEGEYKQTNWAMVSQEDRASFEHTMKHGVIEPTLAIFQDKDVCKHHGCPLDTDQLVNDEDIPIWEKVEQNYKEGAEQYNRVQNFFVKLYMKFFNWWDLRSFKRKQKEVLMTKP
jgi:hypothetical protein